MHVIELPAARIVLDGRVELVDVVTEIGHVGAYDLTISTTVVDLALDVKTTVLGHQSTDTAVSHLVRAPELANCDTQLLAPGGLDGRLPRAARLLEHYATVRTSIEDITGAQARIDVDDHALELALR